MHANLGGVFPRPRHVTLYRSIESTTIRARMANKIYRLIHTGQSEWKSKKNQITIRRDQPKTLKHHRKFSLALDVNWPLHLRASYMITIFNNICCTAILILTWTACNLFVYYTCTHVCNPNVFFLWNYSETKHFFLYLVLQNTTFTPDSPGCQESCPLIQI